MRYVIERFFGAIPIIAILMVAVFMMVHAIPGDAAVVAAGPMATQAEIEEVRRQLGLDRPLIVQFGSWVADLSRGHFGTSLLYRRPVGQMVLERLPATLALAIYSTIWSLAIAVPLGIVSALKPNSFRDRFLATISLIGISVPSFVVGIILIVVFSVNLGWFPSPGGYVPISEDLVEGIRSLTLPALALGYILAAVNTRMIRSSMLDVLREDYVRTARAKGAHTRAVVLKHAFRNALIPVVTVIGLNFGLVVGGAVVIESLFAIPGVGRLLITSVHNRDIPVTQAAILFIALAYLGLNLLTDLIYGAIDPRVRHG